MDSYQDGGSSMDSTIFTPQSSVMSERSECSKEATKKGTRFDGSSVPWPDATYIITERPSGCVITLRDGVILLEKPGKRSGGSIYWECIEKDGWLGFRSPASGKYLGHDMSGKLVCDGPRLHRWERFCVRSRPNEGYILLMPHWEDLWPVFYSVEHGRNVLRKAEKPVAAGLVWEFVKV